MISIYSTINSNNKKFLSKEILNKFTKITKDIVLTTNIKINAEDKKKIKQYSCKLIETTDDREIDLLNTSLSNTNNKIKLHLNLDEYIPIDQKNTWHDLANILIYDTADCYVIPVFDDQLNYITSKWIMHKDSCEVGCLLNRENCLDLVNKESQGPASCKILPIDISTIKEYKYPFIIQTNHVQ